MMPVVFINTQRYAFVDDIIDGRKIYETRCRNTLGGLVGRRVLIAETGHGKPVVRCSAVIKDHFAIKNPRIWDKFRGATRVPEGSKYDWKPETKIKHLYELTGVVACHPFTPPEGARHGRVWMEYEED